jgi:hypothetical protein
MRNKDTMILESLYTKIYNEMAYGLGAGGTPMSIQQIMDLVVHKNQTEGNRETPISMTYVVDYAKSFKKKACTYQNLYKVTQTIATLGEYKAKLNRHLATTGEEPVEEVGARKAVEQRLSQNVGISKTGKPLLLFNITQVQGSTNLFIAREQNGAIRRIEKDEFYNLRYPVKPNPTKEINPAIQSIVALKVGGQEIINTEVPEEKMEVFNLVRNELKS